MSLFSLKGTLKRLPYALIALPILLVVTNGSFIVNYLPIVLQKLNVVITPLDVGIWMGWIFLFFKLLIIPFLIATVKRLHDIGLTGFFALPYLIGDGVRMYAGWVRAMHELGHDLPAPIVQQVITYISIGTYYYGLALACGLCLIPSRKTANRFSQDAA